ncbi:MAG: GntR family transcriptional regulator [Deltaproteobacteria bacterium]|nr:GntR family transcriptional regulator [Deltaproteobacteria bacterium]
MSPIRDIDRTSYEPAYVQLINILKGQIAAGTYLPGSRLPSESQLCKRYKVSPMTVRRSIKALLDQGVVTTIQGSGTFVKAPDMGEARFSLEEFHSLFKDKVNTKVKILGAMVTRADRRIGGKLNVTPGERTILIRRLLVRKSKPFIYHREHLVYDPGRPIVEAELEVTSLHGLFQGTGESSLKRGEFAIKAAVLSKEEADILESAEGQPAFHLEHVFYDFDERPFSWGHFICPGDRVLFRADVGMIKG